MVKKLTSILAILLEKKSAFLSMGETQSKRYLFTKEKNFLSEGEPLSKTVYRKSFTRNLGDKQKKIGFFPKNKSNIFTIGRLGL